MHRCSNRFSGTAERQYAAMETPSVPERKSVQEYLALNRIPPDANNPSVQKFVSCHPAWKPGQELPWGKIRPKRDASGRRSFGPGAFGGHVYAQAPLAAARVVEEEDKDMPINSKRGIHVRCPLSMIPPFSDSALTYPSPYKESLQIQD